ncbi:MAG: hypothetical protein GTO14_03175, partial [Anaerolineales bacterium]|nr:hypothetical protein [Anaerolineales bacterium]
MYSSPYGRQESTEILILDIPSSQLIRFVDLEPYLAPVTWSPDSKHIAFTSTKDGFDDIYVISLDDRSLIPVTDYPTQNYS